MPDKRLIAVALATVAGGFLALLVSSGPAAAEGNRDGVRPDASEEERVQSELVLIVKVEGNGEDVRLEVPLPAEDDRQTIESESFRLRGFTLEEVERDGNRIAVLTYPKLEGRKRFTYKAVVDTAPRRLKFEEPEPGAPVPEALRRWTIPTPRLQSRSPLVRERLVRHVEPRLEAGDRELVRLVYGLVSRQFEHRPGRRGTSNVLKAIRTGAADSRGLERLFVTFLRTAGVPARTSGGLHLSKDGGRKLDRWAEVWVDGRWIPFNVAEGWYATLPADRLQLWHGDRRFIDREGVRRLSFKVLVRDPAPTKTPPPAPTEVASP